MVKKTQKRMEDLAKEVTASLTLDDLTSFCIEQHLMQYEVNDEMFQDDWELYMEPSGDLK